MAGVSDTTMSKSKKPLELNVVHPARLDPNVIVIMSNGMGVESQAIWERWCAEPETRPFLDWSQLIVITAQVGEEHKHDTIKLMEQRTLPMMRERGVRFVELARRGHLEEDGIVVLQDTREPYKLHPEGVYKLSDELLHSGTVPQFGGEHRCAMKFKAFVIETWLAWEFRGHTEPPVYHVFGYNAGEESRIDKSDFHIARHNDDRAVKVESRIPLEIFGFNSEELGRIERSAKYDGPSRTGVYPLLEWGWNRDMCIAYILEKSGLLWVKSHCSFCLAGDTLVMARGGEVPIRDLVGKNRQLLVPRPRTDSILTGILDQGEWADAPVRSFGVQKLWQTRWEGAGRVHHDVFATAEHRWVVKDKGWVTTADLKPGDRIQSILTPGDPASAYRNHYVFYTLAFAEETDREEEVFCATVPGVEAFVLSHGLVTGNCPFCAEASKGEAHAIKRWTEAPVETAHGLLVEYNSLCFNHRGHLYRDRALIDVIEKNNIGPVLVEFARVLESITWGFYRVRRIYTKKGKAMRCVEPLAKGSREDMKVHCAAMIDTSRHGKPVVKRGIEYHMIEEREPDIYPTREAFYVVAPGFMDLKLKGDLKMFDFRWEFVAEHGRFPTKDEEKPHKPKKEKKHANNIATSLVG